MSLQKRSTHELVNYYIAVRKAGRGLHIGHTGGGVPFIKSLSSNQCGSHGLILMAMLGIVIAVAAFLTTASATSVSASPKPLCHVKKL